MSRLLIPLALTLCLIFGVVCLYDQTFSRKKSLSSDLALYYVMPEGFLSASTFEFKGLAADFELLKAIFFVGEKIQNNQTLTDAEWRYFTDRIHGVVSLDPYFYDTYHLANGMLNWGAGRHREAISILEVGRKYNSDDFRFAYHIGFIYYYFLQDFEKGAQYLELASRAPGAPPIIATLASRLGYYRGNYMFSIALLSRMIQSEKSSEVRGLYDKRRKALVAALSIERAVSTFKRFEGRMPEKLAELISLGYLLVLPVDPYGGQWVVLQNGRVSTTSRFARPPEE